jgi:hypothetical protein
VPESKAQIVRRLRAEGRVRHDRRRQQRRSRPRWWPIWHRLSRAHALAAEAAGIVIPGHGSIASSTPSI